MNRRILGVLMIFAFLLLTISGMFMFLKPYNSIVASVHTVFSFIIILSIVLHVFNNRKLIFNYLIGRGANLKMNVIALGITLGLFGIVISIYAGGNFFNSLYVYGNEIRTGSVVRQSESLSYEKIYLGEESFSIPLTIEFKKSDNFGSPIFAIWLEDSVGNYIKTIYISKSISTSVFNQVVKEDNKWIPGIVRRPESLPYWSHKRNIIASDGLYIPLNESKDIDGVSGATPKNNFIVYSSLDLIDSLEYNLMLEVNQSFDWNDYYSKTRFPDDPIYSGSGYVGQPALVYRAKISTRNLDFQNHFIMQLIGHSHYSGMTGELYTDLSNISTAKNIAGRIIVSLGK